MKVFFDLLQLGLAEDEVLAKEGASSPVFSAFRSLSPEEWEALFALARKQALIGICFRGIERLPQAVRPGKALLMRWWALTRQIEERNRVMDERTGEVCRYFEEAGFRVCVLKGQGNARMYPDPLRRQSGDVDIWVVDNKSAVGKICNLSESRKSVLQWVWKQFPDVEPDPKHVHFPLFTDADVEVHFIPANLRSPLANHRLWRFYGEQTERQFSHRVQLTSGQEISAPTTVFNLVFQLCHIFDHFVNEGIGLRQLTDYYYLLKTATMEEKCEAMEIIRRIRLSIFAGALMWVLSETMGQLASEQITKPNEREGRILLSEIMSGGNFGHYESRYWKCGEKRNLRFYMFRFVRMLHFLSHYPADVLLDPWYRIRGRIWMAWMNKIRK